MISNIIGRLSLLRRNTPLFIGLRCLLAEELLHGLFEVLSLLFDRLAVLKYILIVLEHLPPALHQRLQALVEETQLLKTLLHQGFDGRLPQVLILECFQVLLIPFYYFSSYLEVLAHYRLVVVHSLLPLCLLHLGVLFKVIFHHFLLEDHVMMVQRAILDYFPHLLHYISVDSPGQVDGKPSRPQGIDHGYIQLINIVTYPMFSLIPYSQIKELYSSDPTPRYQHILDHFKSHYGTTPEFIARAPGRVNFIGEHIDYEGYGVLPAAIQKDCLIAVRKTHSQHIRINHTHAEQYPPTTLPVHPEAEVHFVNNYVKYFRAGYRAGVRGLPVETLVGLDILIEGNVPLAAGVSSSSALCVCSALAAIHANQGSSSLQSKEQFIQRVIAGERETGTASGGMDHSISVMGKTNFCLYIQFHPIRCTPVHLPEGSRYVVMNSLVESAKLNTAIFRYNKRVCECRLAINMLAKKLKMPKKEGGESYKILKQLEDWSKLPLNTLGSLVDAFLERKDYSPKDIETILEAPLHSFLSDIQLHKEVLKENKTFKLYEAARHVFDEAYRVINFIDVCNSKLEAQTKLALLGKLMNESQTSCRDLYECSCPEIDEITDLARRNGAYGSRLTGAGWGGCTISLVHANQAESFIEAMAEQYYNTKPELLAKIEKIGINNIVFESLPSEGACIISIDN